MTKSRGKDRHEHSSARRTKPTAAIPEEKSRNFYDNMDIVNEGYNENSEEEAISTNKLDEMATDHLRYLLQEKRRKSQGDISLPLDVEKELLKDVPKFIAARDIANKLSTVSPKERFNVLASAAAQLGMTIELRPTTFSSDTDNQLPQVAPSPLYRERADKSENARDFVQRVYGPWLTGEFTRADLRRLDPSAAQGLKNWERLHGKSDLNLPTVIERNDRKLADLAATSGNAAAEISRLRSALIRRQRKPK